MMVIFTVRTRAVDFACGEELYPVVRGVFVRPDGTLAGGDGDVEVLLMMTAFRQVDAWYGFFALCLLSDALRPVVSPLMPFTVFTSVDVRRAR